MKCSMCDVCIGQVRRSTHTGELVAALDFDSKQNLVTVCGNKEIQPRKMLFQVWQGLEILEGAEVIIKWEESFNQRKVTSVQFNLESKTVIAKETNAPKPKYTNNEVARLSKQIYHLECSNKQLQEKIKTAEFERQSLLAQLKEYELNQRAEGKGALPNFIECTNNHSITNAKLPCGFCVLNKLEHLQDLIVAHAVRWKTKADAQSQAGHENNLELAYFNALSLLAERCGIVIPGVRNNESKN